MNAAYWQAAVVMLVALLAAVCGRAAVRKPEGPRHQGGDVVPAGRSVMSIRDRVLREHAEYRLPRALTIALPTLYVRTQGHLKPDPPTDPVPTPGEDAGTSSPLELQFHSPDVELMQRVLDGLRRLPAQRQGD